MNGFTTPSWWSAAAVLLSLIYLPYAIPRLQISISVLGFAECVRGERGEYGYMYVGRYVGV